MGTRAEGCRSKCGGLCGCNPVIRIACYEVTLMTLVRLFF